MPDAKTAEAVYHNLDFQRGVSALINAIPIASMYAMQEGIREGGVPPVRPGLSKSRCISVTEEISANRKSRVDSLLTIGATERSERAQ